MSRTIRQRRHRQRKKAARRRTISTALLVGFLLSIVGTAFAGFEVLKGPGPLPRIASLHEERIGQNSVIYAADGSRMGIIHSDQNRQEIPLDKMGKFAPVAIVSIEDRRFYQHSGVDYTGMIRAADANLKAGHSSQGASTLTQQVVRNLYAGVTKDKTYRRKFKEAILAKELEKVHDKKWILTTYLNLVFFGNNAYGLQAASQTYFSKDAADLTLPEAALLAGLPQAPSQYDPFKNKVDSLTRRNEVLAAMLRDKKISQADYSSAVNTPITLTAGAIYKEHRLPYFFDYVQQQLNKEYGADYVQLGGLQVHTTIKPRLQSLAEKAISDTLNLPTDPSAAMVVLDTKTGAILAMASSENYQKTQFNRAAQSKRQPGSTAKIWVLSAFVRHQYNPDTITYTSRPFKVRCKGCTEYWAPKTYDGTYAGTRTIRSATLASDNSVFAQMGLDITPAEVVRTAHDMGITSPLEPVMSISLGSQVVSPLEQTNVYSTIARGGVRSDPIAIGRVNGPTGDVVPIKRAKPRRVMKDWQAEKIINILQQNMTGGTGTGAYVPSEGSDQAGKTGTTDDHKDAWFCGMKAELTACVWMGYNIPTPMYNVHGISVTGGTFPATIWRRFMEPAMQSGLVKHRPWFTVLGTEMWLPFTSTWEKDPTLDVSLGSNPAYLPAAAKAKPAAAKVTNPVATKPVTPTPAPITPAPTTPAPVTPTPVAPTPGA